MLYLITQMFKRNISVDDVKLVIEAGETIAEYQSDKPYPSCLMLAYINSRPIHIVVGRDEEKDRCIVITAYEPDPNIWQPGFKSKRS
jgi:Domain of unknown function (DUF4258)